MAKYFVGGGDSGALARFTRLHGVADLAQVDDGGEAAIAVEIPASGSATEHLFALDEAGQFAAGDILVRYRMSSGIGAAQWDRGNGAFYRGRSDELTLYSSGLRRVALAAIYSQVSGSHSLLASTNHGNGDNNIYKWCRSNFNGTALKLKVWAGTIGDEPAGWTHSITNSTITAAGWAGIFAAATGTSAVTHYWTHIGISDDPSDPAPHEPVSGGDVGSGAVQAQASTSSGAGAVSYLGSGAAQAGDAGAAGSGAVAHDGAGAAAAQAATASGTGAHGAASSGAGAAAAQNSTASGAGAVAYIGAGAALSSSSTASGMASSALEYTGSGACQAQAASAAGAGKITHVGAGTVAANDSAASGAGSITHTGAGTCQSQAAVAQGFDEYQLSPITFVVPLETRAFTVAAEQREFAVAAEDRTFVVPARTGT